MKTENQTVLNGIDPEIADRLLSRRGLFTSAASRLGVLATPPLVLAAASRQAFGQALPQNVVDVLLFALTLEHIEDAFYRSAFDAGIIPDQYRDVFNYIVVHESAHVALLSGALGTAAIPRPQLDFTAGGKYPDVFSNFDTFTTLAKTFEDLGVAAYKGQAGNLIGSDDILTVALQIHSVEARHAAEVRRIRNESPWDGGAFDEPKTKEEVLAAATPFLVN